MSDWEIHADTPAHLLAVVRNVQANHTGSADVSKDGNNIVVDGTLNNGTRFCLNYYKSKMVPTGGTTTDVFGNTVPAVAAAPGVFAILRWLSPTGDDPPMPGRASGVTMVPLPADSPVRFA